MAFNLEEETVGALILGDYTSLSEGDQVKTTGRIVEVPVGDALIGRVVNPLGEPRSRRSRRDRSSGSPPASSCASRSTRRSRRASRQSTA
jgi:F0F1-type ATP synthase alpha subunit